MSSKTRTTSARHVGTLPLPIAIRLDPDTSICQVLVPSIPPAEFLTRHGRLPLKLATDDSGTMRMALKGSRD